MSDSPVSGEDGDLSSGQESFPVVGIGASAGGLQAFEAFFSGMPADSDPGMAFVLVQHLAPDHESLLTELIRRYTSMQVFEVEDGMPVRPNCAYIIPPGRDMAFLGGTLQLSEPLAPHGRRLPIDFFFRSLAADQRERAIGIVLSGTGSDGTLGVRAIKGEGGMVMAQNPGSCEYDGMPRSALATGLVDYELPPAEMPAQLIGYAKHAFGSPPKRVTTASHFDDALERIFVLLRNRVGHDFSQYKPSTIGRRIERRMAVNQVVNIDDYVAVLEQSGEETEALFRDTLIGVTRFFRDQEAFDALEKQVIPILFSDRPADGAIRVWVPGCSTGEEAYSLAILLREGLEEQRHSYQIQIFATDIDSEAVAFARSGRYPASIRADLTPERLSRFFTPEPSGESGTPPAYRVNQNIRDLLVFSEQSVIKDPPFSRLDLISCRNLIIYLGSELQQKLFPLFSYALRPGGFLFLGSSETVGDNTSLFAEQDRAAKIYRRRDELYGKQREVIDGFVPQMGGTSENEAARPAARAVPPARLPLRELTETALLREAVPAAALVTAAGDILYLHGRTGMYLEPTPGEAGVNNILKMAREGLKHDLTAALHHAAGILQAVHRPGVRVRSNGTYSVVNLTVLPVPHDLEAQRQEKSAGATERALFLVMLREASESVSDASDEKEIEQFSGAGEGAGDAAELPGTDAEATIATLRQQLHARDEYAQIVTEELETSNQELKSSNEEMQSVNEELQASNEELKTSKEELQSINEELSTVNAELQTKVSELSGANNDMNNLLSGTGIATIFVDRQLRIMRFTPRVTRIINVISTDVGRPVGHIVPNLKNYSHLTEDLRSVLDTLTPKEVQVQSAEERWYTMRILPYRTLENVIEGAVITFVDITELMDTQEALRVASERTSRLAVVVEDSRDAITVQDLEGRIIAWNPGAVRAYGWSEAEALEMHVNDRIPADQRAAAITRLQQLSDAEVLEPYATEVLTKAGERVRVSIVATALLDKDGQMYAVATTERVVGGGGPA